MATSDGTPIDAVDEHWRELPDGYEVLGPEDLRQLRGMLAADPCSAVEKLGLRSAEELDAVAVHGAPGPLVERARAALALLRHGEERRPPADYRDAFRAASAGPAPRVLTGFDEEVPGSGYDVGVIRTFEEHPPPVTVKLPDEPGKHLVRTRVERGQVVSAEIVGERDPGPAPAGETRSEYLARRAGGK